MIGLPPATPVIQQLARCGLKAEKLHVRFDDLLQSDVVTVKTGSGADPEMFICIRRAVWGNTDIAFEDTQLDAEYRKFDQAVGTAEVKAQARAWLSSKGLLDKLPTFKVLEQSSSVIEKIEAFCSIPRGTALDEVLPGLISLKRGFLSLPPKPQLSCLLNVLMVVDLEKQGLRFGFIGNEAFSEEPKAPK